MSKNVNNPVIETLLVKGKTDNLATELQVRTHSFFTDEPEELGGEDKSANPLEYCLGALLGCMNVIIRMVANELQVKIKDINLEAAGTFDERGLKGTKDVRPYFEDINITVSIDSPDAAAKKDELIKLTEARCPMYTMLQAADITFKTNWEF